METYSAPARNSHALNGAATQKSIQIPINAREYMTCGIEPRRAHNVIRIARLKPNASGALRAAGPLVEFAEKHLPQVIAALQELASGAAR